MSCPKLAEGDIVRVTRVDGCGAPVEGADNAFVDDCWASVAMAANVETGTDIDFKSMSGRSCAFKRGCPSFRGFDITGEFYSASPELIEILTGNPIVEDFDGNPVGWDDCSVACATGFALEVWQNIIGDECIEGAEGQWFYWLLPWVSNGVLGDITVGSEGVTFSLTGNTRASGSWSLGPWDVVDNDGTGTAGPLLTPLGTDCHRRGLLSVISPPEASCDYVTVGPNNIAPS